MVCLFSLHHLNVSGVGCFRGLFTPSVSVGIRGSRGLTHLAIVQICKRRDDHVLLDARERVGSFMEHLASVVAEQSRFLLRMIPTKSLRRLPHEWCRVRDSNSHGVSSWEF